MQISNNSRVRKKKTWNLRCIHKFLKIRSSNSVFRLLAKFLFVFSRSKIQFFVIKNLKIESKEKVSLHSALICKIGKRTFYTTNSIKWDFINNFGRILVSRQFMSIAKTFVSLKFADFVRMNSQNVMYRCICAYKFSFFAYILRE